MSARDWVEAQLGNQPAQLVRDWAAAAGDALRADVVSAAVSRTDLEALRLALIEAIESDGLELTDGHGWTELRLEVERFARSRARAGAPVGDSSAMLLVLKDVLRDRVDDDDDDASDGMIALDRLIDAMVLWLVEVRADRLDQIIERQRQEMRELSTPVIELWRGVVALPLVGTLDSARAELVMESLLEGISKHDARVAILDITGVPGVDSMIAQRLLRTASAARLMGAECIISGIGPRIAHTMVQIGVDIGTVRTTSRLSDALAMAFVTLGLQVNTRPE